MTDHNSIIGRGMRRSPEDRRRAKRAKRPDLTTSEIDRLNDKVGRVTCSRTWGDHAAAEADRQGIQPHSDRVPELLAKFEIYPPPEDEGPRGRRSAPVRMVRCSICGKSYPPMYLIGCNGHSRCLDCCILRGAKARKPARGRVFREHALVISETPAARMELIYAQLRDLGFTDQEIAVLSLWLDGNPLRKIADWNGLSPTHVHRILIAAREKAAAEHLELPPRRTFRMKDMDPRLMDRTIAAPAAC